MTASQQNTTSSPEAINYFDAQRIAEEYGLDYNKFCAAHRAMRDLAQNVVAPGIKKALATVVQEITSMGPERFRELVESQPPGDIAMALNELSGVFQAPPPGVEIEPIFVDFTDKRGRVWEWFIDAAYYDMTCVRVKGESDFNSQLSFHFATSSKAAEFVKLLKQSS